MMIEQIQPVDRNGVEETAANHGKRRDYLPTLDGWRAIAIIWVIESHTRLWSVGRFSSQWIRFHGDRGVQLFFALSGLLICSRLLDEEQRFGAISLRSFYTRRLFRIQPAALTYLAVISLLMLIGGITAVWTPVVGAALMIRDIWPWAAHNWQTGHFWSLAVEEHFYLVFPGFLVLCRRYRLALTSVMVVALEFWRHFVLRSPRLQEYAMVPQLRTDLVVSGILLGCVFALALRRPQLREYARAYLYPWVALLYTAAVFARLQLHHSSNDHALLITVYPVLLVATMLHPESLTSRFLELRPLRYIGRISYSLYLWQQLFVPGDDAVAPHTYRTHVFLCWLAAFACAIVSYHSIETPLVRLGHRIAKRFDLQTKREKYDHATAAVPQLP
jgi:peptidoglycan/LPS O-acetylase OafA/YrhL